MATKKARPPKAVSNSRKAEGMRETIIRAATEMINSKSYALATLTGIAAKLDIGWFARMAGQAGARLVYLSSCQGSSARSILDLVQHGVQHAAGFRCNVDDAKAATFAADFYEALFKPSSIPAAFQTACMKARKALDDDEEDPIWASPMLVAQSSDWAARF